MLHLTMVGEDDGYVTFFFLGGECGQIEGILCQIYGYDISKVVGWNSRLCFIKLQEMHKCKVTRQF